MKLLHQGNHQFRFYKPKNLDFPLHLHNAVEIVFLTGGSADVLYSGSRRPLGPGEVFICFPNQVHGYENSKDTRGYVLIIPVNPYLSAFRSTLDQKLPAEPILPTGTWEHTALAQLLNFAYQDLNTASKQVTQGYLLLIVGKLLSLLHLKDAASGSADVLQTVLLYVNEHYTQPISRKDIAKAVGCNESYISHLFSDTFQTTLTDYITSLRLSDALELLTNTTQPVSQIALSLGFGSIRSFNRIFAKKMHMSPTAYREAAKR